MDKFLSMKAKYKISCYISSSVDEECKEKMEKVLNFVGQAIPLLTMGLAAEKARTQHEILLMEQDILLIELLIGDLFKKLSKKAGLEDREPPEIEQMLLRTLEYSLVDFLEQRFKEDASLSMEELQVFLAKILDDFLTMKEAFNIQKKELAKKIDITPEPEIVKDICKLGIPKKDSRHILSAMQHTFSNNLTAVFASFDYKHIVNFQEQIYLHWKFQVCDPLYAYSHLRNEKTFEELVNSRSRKKQSSIADWNP